MANSEFISLKRHSNEIIAFCFDLISEVLNNIFENYNFIILGTQINKVCIQYDQVNEYDKYDNNLHFLLCTVSIGPTVQISKFT